MGRGRKFEASYQKSSFGSGEKGDSAAVDEAVLSQGAIRELPVKWNKES